MKSKYWIKLYHECLDDPKMGRLSDRLYRRTIEMFLLAGDYDQAGFLPPLDDIAWRLHLEPEQLETDLIELQRIGILDVIDGRWYVAKFAERQAADTDTERWRRWKERQAKTLGSVPPAQPASVDAYTNQQRIANDMLVDKEVDIEAEVDIESEAEADHAPATGPPQTLEILHAAGIYEPTATRLAKKPWMTPQYLEAHIAEAERLGISTGLLVTRLANNDPPPLSPEQIDAQDRARYAIDAQKYGYG